MISGMPWPAPGGQLIASTLMLLLLAVLASPAAAQDTVVLQVPGQEGTTRVGGRVVEYTGRQLELEIGGSHRRTVPAEQVLRVETHHTAEQTEADALFDERRFAEALARYKQALDREPRTWVRRRIVAQVVWCHRALGQVEQAGETFLVLLSSDPHTLDFDAIPLAWMPGQPSVSLEQAARRWLAREEPAAGLMGASHLLAGSRRLEAQRRLRELSTSSDRRVAMLATAQLWRTAVATVDADAVQRWARLVEQLPDALAVGPYYVLGQAYARLGQWEPAALAMLRAPLVDPRDRPLAARALVDAGRALEQLGRNREAAGLYQEVLRDYPEQTRAAAEAESRLNAGSSTP